MNYIPLSKIRYSDPKNYEKIYKERFTSPSSEHFNFSISGNEAFFIVNNELLSQITELYEMNTKLDSITKQLPNIALNQFTKKCLIDEIHLTNDIEGVYSTRKEIDEILSMTVPKSQKNNRIFGLVKKYELIGSENIPLKTCADIRNLYDELVLTEVLQQDSENAPDGKLFRKDIAVVMNKFQKIIHKGVYPESDLIEMMQISLDFLNNKNYTKFIRIAVFHYLFGYMHPFYDGNGRTSRFISSYLLSKFLNPLVCYSLSYTIKNNISKYYKSFEITNDKNNRGDITPFIFGFLEILKSLYSDLIDIMNEKLEQIIYYHHISIKITDNKNDYKYRNFIFVLFQNSICGEYGLTVPELVEAVDVSQATIRKYLKWAKEFLYIEKDGHAYRYSMNLNIDYSKLR
ncbi:MAG: Fic family protein [Christensenellales bacterium]